MTSRPEEIRQLARERLGFSELRPGQLEGVESVLDGRDTLCVMATGSGKTAVYELAGLMLSGPTIVVSPLIALQRDQASALGSDVAAVFNSSLGPRGRAQALHAIRDGDVDFILMSPEQLARADVRAELAASRPSLFVVDEAHCVSQWGYEFRPDYLELAAAVDALGRPPVLALTATAAPPVRRDIASVLALRDPVELVRGFDRPNIRLTVRRFHDDRHKRAALFEAVAVAEGPGLVYVATQHASEEVASALVQQGITARAYHAGLGARLRNTVQDDFMADRECRVIVATVAFGMGVDKPNVRWVFHEEISDSVDAYYQEIGRAGRNGHPAHACLFYRAEDLGLRSFFTGRGIDRASIDRVVDMLAETGGSVSPNALAEGAGMSRTRAMTVVHDLEASGVVAFDLDGAVRALGDADALRRAVDGAAELEHNRHEFARSRIAMMRAYAERRQCRREFLLGYFGEELVPPCGNCDNDERDPQPTARPAGYRVGDRVRHPTWEKGTVIDSERGEVTVVFDSIGYRTLDAELVATRGLLSRL